MTTEIEEFPPFDKTGYRFSKDWFTKSQILWAPMLATLKPKRILEVGSFEGLSAVFMAERTAPYTDVEIHCIDNWQGGVEHDGINFDEVESNFDYNVDLVKNKKLPHSVAIVKHKGASLVELCKLIAAGTELFDLVYIDGSHLAMDVMADAVLGFNLLKDGGYLIFDDYNSPNPETVEFPKIAIDSFGKVFSNKLKKIQFKDQNGQSLERDLGDNKYQGLYQLYLVKE